MPNERKYREERAYEQRLVEHGILQRRALGLIVIGAVCLLAGIVSHDEFTVTVGLIGVGAGGIWWRCLT